MVVELFGPVNGGGGGPSGDGEQSHVQSDRQRVPRVVHGSDGRHGVHGPVEAEPPRMDQQSDVLDRQIEERQRPGYQTRRFGRWIVRGREYGRPSLAHQRHPYE